MSQLTMKISGMTCGHCVGSVKKALAGLDGVTVERVEIGSAVVSYDANATSSQQITQTVEDEGYAVVSAT